MRKEAAQAALELQVLEAEEKSVSKRLKSLRKRERNEHTKPRVLILNMVLAQKGIL
jgi:hypothetical protein